MVARAAVKGADVSKYVKTYVVILLPSILLQFNLYQYILFLYNQSTLIRTIQAKAERLARLEARVARILVTTTVRPARQVARAVRAVRAATTIRLRFLLLNLALVHATSMVAPEVLAVFNTFAAILLILAYLGFATGMGCDIAAFYLAECHLDPPLEDLDSNLEQALFHFRLCLRLALDEGQCVTDEQCALAKAQVARLERAISS